MTLEPSHADGKKSDTEPSNGPTLGRELPEARWPARKNFTGLGRSVPKSCIFWSPLAA